MWTMTAVAQPSPRPLGLGLRLRSASRGVARLAADPKLLVVLFCFAFPLLLRLYALRNPVPLNPDEAQWTVSARRILDDPVVWRSNDLETSGPLNGLAISWPLLFGAVPSIYTSRLTGLLLQSGTLAGLACLVKVDLRYAPANVALLIATLFLGLQTAPGYIHYSSELVSLALLVTAAALLSGIRPRRAAPWRWGLCGLAVCCLPLAKLQSSVLALLVGAVCLIRLAAEIRSPGAAKRSVGRRRAGWGDAAAFAGGGALPLALLVLPPFLVGEGRAVLDGYLLRAVGYGGTRTLAHFVALALFIVLQAALFFTGALGHGRRGLSVARADLRLLGFGLWPALFLTVWLPGRLFEHYNLYLIVGLPLAVALVQRGTPAPAGGRRAAGAALAFACAALSLYGGRDLLPQATAANLRAAVDDGFAVDDRARRSRPLYAWTGAAPGDAMLVWGWEPRFTAYAGLRSADRTAQAEYLIRPNPGRGYFRARLLGELARALPALVLDTTRPGYYFNNDPAYEPDRSTIDSFPALAAIVHGRYLPVGGGGRCAALYLRDDLAAAWRRSEIVVSSSEPSLVGGAMTETCGDWWAPDAAGHASATLSLASPEPVHQVWLLASRGGPARDRGTTGVRVTLVAATGERRERVVGLFDYPSWTVVEGDDGFDVARIQVEPLASTGAGPALAAVKAFRPPAAPSAIPGAAPRVAAARP